MNFGLKHITGIVCLAGAIGWLPSTSLAADQCPQILPDYNRVCGILNAKKLRQIDELDGNCFTISVKAASKWNSSGIRLTPGKYNIKLLDAKREWKDSVLDADENGWTDEAKEVVDNLSLISQMFIGLTPILRRAPDQEWFRLMGMVAEEGEHVFTIDDGEIFRLKEEKGGEFCAFANDLPWKYGNNSGSLKLQVTKTETNQPISTAPRYEFEIIPPIEQEGIDDITIKTGELQAKRALFFTDQNSKKLRGVHPKSHGCVVGDLTINQDIVPNLQVGLFSNPGKHYNSLVRFSNASVRLSPDLERGNSSRGMAIKVFDVEQEVIIPDREGARNQDFLMINTPSFAFPNVRSYRRLTQALFDSPSGADPGAALKPAAGWEKEDFVNLKKTGKVLVEIAKKTVRNPLEVQYFAAAPSAFGADRVMKFSAEPCGGEIEQETFNNPSLGDPVKDYLHDALAFTMSKNENVCFDLKIQVLNGEQVAAHRKRSALTGGGDLIEDASLVWDEDEFPFIPVAKLILRGPQEIDLTSSEQLDCESQAFNPWHSVKDHKPLGGINRLRKPVYINSAANRN